MTIKKKGYVKPIIAAEEFVPQEYVAACAPVNDVTSYYLACDGTSGSCNCKKCFTGRPHAFNMNIINE